MLISGILQQRFLDTIYHVVEDVFSSHFRVYDANTNSHFSVDGTYDIEGNHRSFFLIEETKGNYKIMDFLDLAGLPSDLRYLYHILYAKNKNIHMRYDYLFNALNDSLWYKLFSILSGIKLEKTIKFTS